MNGIENTQNKKIELIQWLSTLNDESMIEKIIKLRESEKSDYKILWTDYALSELYIRLKFYLSSQTDKIRTG